MDKLLSTLLSTSWGRSFIGWTNIAFFVCMVALGWAYLDLKAKNEAKELRREQEVELVRAKLEKCWECRYDDLSRFHARQDSLDNRISKQLNKRRR